MDALLWTASERSRKRRKFLMIVLHLSFAIAYAFSHAILVLLQVYKNKRLINQLKIKKIF